MHKIIPLGSAPSLEPYLRSSPDFEKRFIAQCFRFIDLLREKFGDEPPGASFFIAAPVVPYPNLWEVVYHYHIENLEAHCYIVRCLKYRPTTWNDRKPPEIPLN